MRITSPKYLLAAAIGLGACWGCGAAGSGSLPALIPVKGKVTYKGQPLTRGLIRFEPDGYGRPARGRIQPDGTYALTTDKEGDGVVAGFHNVTVFDTEIKSPRNVLAKKYGEAATSGFTAQVDAEHTEFNFNLE